MWIFICPLSFYGLTHNCTSFYLNITSSEISRNGDHHHADQNHAIDRIFHLWARANRDLIDGKVTHFDGTGHNAEGLGLHFMVMHHLHCQDIAKLKAYILENSDAFATSVREQIVLLMDIKEQMYQSENAAC